MACEERAAKVAGEFRVPDAATPWTPIRGPPADQGWGQGHVRVGEGRGLADARSLGGPPHLGEPAVVDAEDLEQHWLCVAVWGPGSPDGRADGDLVAIDEDVLGDDADAGEPGGELAPGVLARLEPGGAEWMAEEIGGEQAVGLVELPGIEALLPPL